jgi:transcriptional regulator with XRE-family HTH domain
MDTWSEKVRALEAAGMTLTEIARQTGMSLPGVSDVKQGRTKNPGGMPAVRLHTLFEERVGSVDRGSITPACCEVSLAREGRV